MKTVKTIEGCVIDKFRTLHRQKYGIDIAYESAERELKGLAEMVRLTAPKEVARSG